MDARPDLRGDLRRTPNLKRIGTGAVLIIFDPHAAIVGAFDGQFLVDPKAFDNLQLVAALLPYRNGERDDLERAFAIAGIPGGLDSNGLLEWLDHGMPVE